MPRYTRGVDLESGCCISVCRNPVMCMSQPGTALTLVYNKLLGTHVVPLPLALAIPAHLILTTGCYMVVVCFANPCAQRYCLPCWQPWLKNCLQWFGSEDNRKGELLVGAVCIGWSCMCWLELYVLVGAGCASWSWLC